jgi:hypothetical protein
LIQKSARIEIWLQWVSIIAARQRRRLIGGAAAVNLRTLPIVVLNTIPHSGIIFSAESYEFLKYVSKKFVDWPNSDLGP